MVDNVSSVKTEPTPKPQVVVPPGSKPEMYRAFFQPLVNILRKEYGFNPTEGGSKNWKSFPIPSLSAILSYRVVFAGDGRVMVNLYIDRNDREWDKDKEWNEQLFDNLRERKEDIESKLGESLSWERMDDYRACRIAVYRPGTIDDEPERLAEIREWMIEWLLAFRRVFEPELERLLK